MDPRFVHLHVHTEYSLVDGLLRIRPMVEAAAAAGMPAIAVTDQVNLFALVRFYKAAQAAGLKPLAGADLWVRNPAEVPRPFRLTRLVQNQTGYRHLTRLLSRAYLEGQHLGRPQVESAWIAQAADGLIALSGGVAGDVGQALLAGDTRSARQRADAWRAAFGDRYYLEVTRTGRPQEGEYLAAAVDLAGTANLPVVATNDVRFLAPGDFEAHEVRVCIHEGRLLDDTRRPRPYSAEQYLRTPEEMAELFADLPEALENTLEIARRCNLSLTLGQHFLPAFPVPEGLSTADFFSRQARAGLDARLARRPVSGEGNPRAEPRVYAERLQGELEVINQMGFAGYFLIVADFIRWAREQGIPVGPGRGSGAGSLVAYALGITDLDPIEHVLLFERFLNPERVSMPDFDVDFCMEKRDRVIEYVAERYGRQAVSQIITFGTLAAKAVVRDVGRVLGHPYGFVDKIAKMVPFELKMTLDRALEESEDLKQAYAGDEEVRAILDMARKLEGLARNASKHAGGVVIAPTELTDFAPLYCEPGGANLVTQYDKDDVEAVGLVKFDFLGLRTLTVIDWALKTIHAAHPQAPPIDITAIDPHDPEAFALLKRCATTAVFQLESRGMKELIKKLRPDSFEDMTALVALFRPGPLQSGMVDDFIARKHGEAEVAYPHPDLEPILKPTYGIILYQEQVMQIAQVLAGYSLGGADLLRRAMGKKKKEEMDKQRAVFEQGAIERGVAAATATYIFDLMDKFAGYGFNRSHSAAYALVSYQTLWLKAHYPAAFMAAVLSADMDNTDKVVPLIDECQALKLHLLPPAINRSEYRFTIADDQTLVYGLGAIKGVGEQAIEALLESRRSGGAFRDLWDFCRRIDLGKANRRVLEALIRAGALDALGANRATLMAQLAPAVRLAEQFKEGQKTGQVDFFGAAEVSAVPVPDPQLAARPWPEWEEEERLQGEKDTLGVYLTGHPVTRFAAEIDALVGTRIGPLLETAGTRDRDSRTVAGLVVSVRHSKNARGRMGSVVLDDCTGRLEVAVFSGLYEQVRELLETDRILAIRGVLNFDDFRDRWALRAQSVRTLEQAREAEADHLLLTLDGTDAAAVGDRVDALRETLAAYRGSLAVHILYRCPGASGRLVLGEAWRVRPEEVLLKRLRQLPGLTGVQVSYQRFQPPSVTGH